MARAGVFIAVMVCANVLGNALLSLGMQAFGRMLSFAPEGYFQALLNPTVWAGICALMLSGISQAALLSWADLSYVMPLTAAGYVLTALVGKFFFGDLVPLVHWAGILLIGCGVLLVSRTPSETHL